MTDPSLHGCPFGCCSAPQAYQRACRNLYPIPRYNEHTITEAINAKYGQVRFIYVYYVYKEACQGGMYGNAAELC